MEDKKPKTAIDTLILINDRRIESVEDGLSNTPNLVIPEQLQEDICALIISVKEYNSFLKDIKNVPDEANDYH